MTGHRPSYLRRIINLLISKNYKVIVAMPSHCFKHQVAEEIFSKHDPYKLSKVRCDLTYLNFGRLNPIHMLLNEYRCLQFYRCALKKAETQSKIDLMFIQSLDDILILSGITGLNFGQVPWVGIVMKQSFHFIKMGAKGPRKDRQAPIKQKLFIRLLARMPDDSLVMTIDELLLEYIKTNHPVISRSLRHIPDAVDDRVPVTNSNIRNELGIPTDAFVVMAYGSLREKKGVNLLVDALHDLPDNIHVMLIGTQLAEVKTYLAKEQNLHVLTSGRLHQVDRYIDVTEDANFFSAADLIWVGYKDYFNMSAVLVQAAQYRRPVLAASTGLVGWITTKYKTGVVIDTYNQRDIVSSILQASKNNVVPDKSHYSNLVETHSLKAFENALIPAVKKLIRPT